MTIKTRSAVLVGLLLSALLSGCDGGASADRSPTPASPATAAELEPVWEVTGDVVASGRPVPVQRGGHVLFQSANSLIALDPTTGVEAWRFKRMVCALSEERSGRIAVTFATAEGAQENTCDRVGVIDLRAGDLIWKRPAAGTSVVTLGEKTVTTADRPGMAVRIQRYSWEDGAPLPELPRLDGMSMSAVLGSWQIESDFDLPGDRSARSHDLVARNLDTGAERWRIKDAAGKRQIVQILSIDPLIVTEMVPKRPGADVGDFVRVELDSKTGKRVRIFDSRPDELYRQPWTHTVGRNGDVWVTRTNDYTERIDAWGQPVAIDMRRGKLLWDDFPEGARRLVGVDESGVLAVHQVTTPGSSGIADRVVVARHDPRNLSDYEVLGTVGWDPRETDAPLPVIMVGDLALFVFPDAPSNEPQRLVAFKVPATGSAEDLWADDRLSPYDRNLRGWCVSRWPRPRRPHKHLSAPGGAEGAEYCVR